MSEKVDHQLRRKVWIGIFLGLLVFWGTIATIVTLALASAKSFYCYLVSPRQVQERSALYYRRKVKI